MIKQARVNYNGCYEAPVVNKDIAPKMPALQGIRVILLISDAAGSTGKCLN
jgi:hypothetical protein